MLSQHDAKLDAIFQHLVNSGSGKQQNANQDTKASVSEGWKKQLKKLAEALGVEGARDLNKAFYERLQHERAKGTTEWILGDAAVQSWMQGETSFVVVNGHSGNGKTFVASRIVEQLLTNKSNVSGLDKAVAYFFCRKGPGERNSVVLALKTMAYDIAVSDKLFANNLSGLIKDHSLQSARPVSNVESVAAKMDSITAQYNSIVANSEAIAANLDSTTAQLNSIGANFDAVADETSMGISESASKNNGEQKSHPAGQPFPDTGHMLEFISDEQDRTEVQEILSASTPLTEAGDEEQLPERQDLSPGLDPGTTQSTDTDLDSKLHRVSTAVLQDIPLDDEDEEATVWDIQRHWEKLFIQTPKTFEKHIYLVLDGLDECDETEAIALCAAINAGAGAVADRAASRIHVLLLMNVDRVTMFESHALTSASTVDINSTIVVGDVERLVRERIWSAWEKKLVHSNLREEYVKAVIQSCGSNLLKASLLVNEVTSLLREDIIRDSLSNLPETAKTMQSATLLAVKRLASQMNSYYREDFHVSKDAIVEVDCR